MGRLELVELLPKVSSLLQRTKYDHACVVLRNMLKQSINKSKQSSFLKWRSNADLDTIYTKKKKSDQFAMFFKSLMIGKDKGNAIKAF